MQAKKNIFRFLCISIFFGICYAGHAQADSTKRIGGLTVGIDVSRFLVRIWKPVKGNFEFSLESTVTKNISVIGEAGILHTNFSEDTYNYESKGSYFRLGTQFNLLKREYDDNDKLYIGLLYGFSTFSHKADYIQITDGYWGSGSGSLPLTSLTGNWFEVKIGLRVEIIRNWSLGWAIRTRIYMFGKEDPIMSPYIIPGYGKHDKSPAIGMSYSVFYQIPYRKRK